jgi:hypothetical protein
MDKVHLHLQQRIRIKEIKVFQKMSTRGCDVKHEKKKERKKKGKKKNLQHNLLLSKSKLL